MNFLVCGVILTTLFYVRGLPIVQPGLFVISGVTTCGQGSGYCLLGIDCTMNEDFLADEKGHCDGLRTAFTPETYFSCCQYASKNSTFVEEDTLRVLNSQLSDTEVNQTTISDVEDVNTNEFNGSRLAENDFKIRNVGNGELGNEIDENKNKRSSRTDDMSSMSNIAEERIIDINNLGCPEFVHNHFHSNRPIIKLSNNSSSSDSKKIMHSRNLEIENLNADNEHVDNFSLMNPVQNFLIARSLSAKLDSINKNCSHNLNTEYPRRPSLTIDEEQLKTRLGIPEELRGNSNILKDKFTKNKCVNFTTETDTLKRCVNVWKFISNDTIICFGTLVNSVWLLTSASCVTKIFETRMDSVKVTDVEEISGLYGISNMIVHENYKTDEQSEMNDIGLVSLNKVTNSSCFACLLNQEKKYADKSCSTYTIATNRNNQKSLNKCQERLKVLNINSRMYLSLTCSSTDSYRLMAENSSGNALWCENAMLGIETSFDQGNFVFTSINEYADWIRQNILLYL